MHNRRQLFPGLIVVAVGLIFLGINYGWWSASIWAVIVSYWPVLLILIGINMILRNSLATLVIALAVIVAILLGAESGQHELNLSNALRLQSQTQTRSVAGDLSGVTKLKLKLEMGASTVTIDALSDANADKLFSGDAATHDAIKIERTDRDGTAEITISDPSHVVLGGHRGLNLSLSRKVALELDLETGASDVTLDLSNLNVSNLKLSAGASTSRVTLGTIADNLNTEIDTGASNLTLRVPKDSGIKIKADTGLTSKNFEDQGLVKTEDTFTTDGFDNAAKKIDVKLSAGASTITLDRY